VKFSHVLEATSEQENPSMPDSMLRKPDADAPPASTASQIAATLALPALLLLYLLLGLVLPCIFELPID
jgi:hypothetical protein